jgi:hypothetical protein
MEPKSRVSEIERMSKQTFWGQETRNREVLERLGPGHSEGSHRRRIREELACARSHVGISKVGESELAHTQTLDTRNRDVPLVR